MNGKKLWVHFWTDRQKQSKRNNCNEGLKFLMSYDMTEPENVLKELQDGLRMTIAGKWGSGYVVIMPNIRREEELIRNRLATHPFEPSEWPIHEILGLPNRRYSIFIYNEHTCPQYASIAETDWRMEYSEGIPVYEKGFNVAYLNRTFPKLKRILISIYQGGTPQPTVLKPITTESKNYKNMKKNVQRINESQLRAIVAESVKNVLNERTYSPTDGQYAYQWSDKVRQARANDLGMKPDGRIEHYNDFNPFLSYTEYNKNDMERKRKAGNYNGNHAPSPRPSIYNAYLTIVHSGVDACVQHYGRTITAEAIKDLAEIWDGEKDDIEDDEI